MAGPLEINRIVGLRAFYALDGGTINAPVEGQPDDPPATPPVSERNANRHLIVLHFNDLHGHLENATRLASEVKRIKSENPEAEIILLSGGDVISGTLISEIFKGQAELAFYKYLNVDVNVLGNHDFAFGVDAFCANKPPNTVAANFNVKGRACPDSPKTNSDSEGRPLLPPYVIVNLHGLKVAVVGAVLSDIAKQMNSETKNELTPEVGNPPTVVKEALKKLEDKVDIAIALTHESSEEDDQLAAAAAKAGLDLIISGHFHYNYESIKYVHCREVQNIPICIAKENGTTLGRVDLEITTRGDVKKIENQIISIDKTIPEDAATVSVLKDYMAAADAEQKRLSEPIGFIDKPYGKKKGKYGQAPVGQLIAETMREEVGTNFGLINSGGIRYGINQGLINSANIKNIFPHNSPIIILHISGKELKTSLESYRQRHSKYLQLAGITYDKLDTLEPDKIYTIAVDNFVADIFPKDIQSEQTEKTVTGALAGYIKHHMPIR